MLTEKQFIRSIVVNLVKVAVILILAGLVIGVFSKLIHRISSSIYEKEGLALLLEKRSENLIKIKSELDKIGNPEQTIENAFPNSDNVLEFVSSMESLAATYSIKQTLRFGNSVPAPELATADLNFLVIDYNLTLAGNINILINYLKDFEQLPYFTAINSFTITSGTDWFNESQIGIQAKLYLKK